MNTNYAPLYERNAAERARTECIRGHQFDERNTGRRRDGRRFCRACQCARAFDWKIRASKKEDGIVDEVAVERASFGDISVYQSLTRQEHRALVLLLVDREELPPIPNLRSAVNQERGRRRRGLVD